MKKILIRMSCIIMCMCACFIVSDAKETKASSISVENKTDKLDNDLAKAHSEFLCAITELEKTAIMDFDGIYSSFIRDNKAILKSADKQEGIKALYELRKKTYIEINDIYSVRLESADKVFYEYKDTLTSIMENYRDYNLTLREVNDKVNTYLTMVDSNNISNILKSKFESTKSSIKEVLSDSKHLLSE